jgi:hypothetical protein
LLDYIISSLVKAIEFPRMSSHLSCTGACGAARTLLFRKKDIDCPRNCENEPRGAAIRDGGERLKPPLSPVRDAMGDLMSRLQFITSRIPSHRGGSAAGLTISSPI